MMMPEAVAARSGASFWAATVIPDVVGESGKSCSPHRSRGRLEAAEPETVGDHEHARERHRGTGKHRVEEASSSDR